MPVSKGRHLVMFDRRMIEDMLRDGESVGAIAGKIGVSWATVAREIKRHRTRDTTHYQNLDGKNLCQFRDSCRMTNMCRTGCNSRCSRCASAACNKVCEKYVEVPECPKLSRAPYVCNGCRSRITLACRHRCWFYDADAANEEAAWAKVAGRQGVDCSPEELAAMVAVVKPLMKKGQSLSHIWQTHGSEFPVGARTFYRYINLGILDICNLELPKKVKYKPRRRRKKDEVPFRHSLEGRTYEDFQRLDYDVQMSAVEMDCVVSAKGSDKAILTLLFRRFCFQIMVMLPAHTSECVTRALDSIEMLCGRQAFMDSFNVLLTDRGSEFLDYEAIERSVDGGRRCSVYYCDPLQSGQKGRCEKNHVELRKILPKGTCFEGITNYELSIICSHVNSYTRPVLGGTAPIDIASRILPADLFDGLAIRKINPDEVVMRPSLLAELGPR